MPLHWLTIIEFIDNRIFANCSSLKSITFPNSITGCGDDIFYNSEISNIILSDGITAIGDKGFANYSCLESVIIPDSVTSLGFELFSGSGRSIFDNYEMTYKEGNIDVYYTGTKENWDKIVNPYFDYNANVPVTVHYNSTFPEQIALDVSELTLSLNDTYTLVPSLTPADVTASKIYFSSDSYAVSCSDDGKITARQTGTATITAMTSNGLTAQVKVNSVAGEEHSCETQGHIEVTDYGYAVTCTKSGLSDGSHCSVCGEILVEQKEIPALGHTWGNWSTIKLPTATENGERMHTCTVCNVSEVQNISYSESQDITEETKNPNYNTTNTPTSQPATSPNFLSTESPDSIIPINIKKVAKLTGKNNKKKAVTLSWKKITGVAGYEIQYAANKKFRSVKKKKAQNSKIVIKKLQKEKTYYFRVCAYKKQGGKIVYGKWSNVKKIKIKK